MPTLKDIITVLEKAAPPGLASEWDNSGLQVGDPSRPVKKVLVALDPLPAVMAEAKALGADLLVAHHPLFFKSVKRLDLSQGTGKVVRAAVRDGVAVYSAHTSLDRAVCGVSDALAKPLGLKEVVPLQPAEGGPAGCGFGRVGNLPRRLKVSEVARKLKAALNVGKVRLIGDPQKAALKVAVCGGSGAELIDDAIAAGAELYVTGDVKYHDALKALELGLTVLDVGHFASESLAMPHLAGILDDAFRKKGWDVKVEVSKAQEEPWSYL